MSWDKYLGEFNSTALTCPAEAGRRRINFTFTSESRIDADGFPAHTQNHIRKFGTSKFNLKTTHPNNNFQFSRLFSGEFYDCFSNTKAAFLNLTILAMMFVSCLAFGQTTSSIVNTSAPPAWVDWLTSETETKVPLDQSQHGQIFMLFDEQVNATTYETFVHVEKEITSEDAVQNGANLAFPYDPSFQELILHQMIIHRDGQNYDRLDPAKFKIIQQETDLSRQIYNGTLSALLFIEDVRVGDRIEYAYTIRGKNPVLQGRYTDTFFTKLSVPVEHLRFRLLWPENRKLNFKTHGAEVEPTVQEHNGLKEYVWDLHNLSAVDPEDQTPSWYPIYPWLQLSEFNNWSEVAAWASRLYVNTTLESPELKKQISKLQLPGATTEQTVQAVLNFVQNDIRYLGIEFGPNSYHPTDPATVLQRRFGDCKDKAFLFCTLLRGLGYEATPALVATGFRQTLPDLLPAPHDFDHVIVRVVADGKTYWVDPTRTYQRGPATERYLPDYGYGLLLQPGESDLTPIPASDVGLPETYTSEKFIVSGQKAPAHLTVISTYNGFDAEWMRAALASIGREGIAKSYLNDYARRYPGVISAAPFIVDDFPKSDTLVITHEYTISNFWVLAPDKQHYRCEFYPLGIHSWIMKPTTSIRSMPLELSFPRERIVHTEINLPREFKLSNFTNTITGPGAELYIQRTFFGRTVTLDYKYRALTNFVPVSLVADHLGSLDRMENALGYSLIWETMDTSGTNQFNWPIFLLIAFYSLLLAIGVALTYRFQNRSPVQISPVPPIIESSVSGLGGWLILVGLGLVFSAFRLIFVMIRTSNLFSLWKWQALTTPGGISYQPAMAPLLIFEFLGYLTTMALCLFALVLFFQKRRFFPRWFIGMLIFNATFILLDSVAAKMLIHSSNPQSEITMTRNLAQVVVGCSIWIPYMCVSRRVKATFVR